MTAIVAIADGERVWMGCDSMSATRMNAMPRADPKMFRRGAYLIGFTSSYRMGQLLRYRVDLPEPYEWEHDLFAFMATRFVDAVRQTFRDYAFSTVKDSVEEGGEFLVGFRGQIFHIWGDYQVMQRAERYDACGSGDDIALGSLFSTAASEGGEELEPASRIAEALTAAEHFNIGVRRPFIVEVLGEHNQPSVDPTPDSPVEPDDHLGHVGIFKAGR